MKFFITQAQLDAQVKEYTEKIDAATIITQDEEGKEVRTLITASMFEDEVNAKTDLTKQLTSVTTAKDKAEAALKVATDKLTELGHTTATPPVDAASQHGEQQSAGPMPNEVNIDALSTSKLADSVLGTKADPSDTFMKLKS